MRVDGGAGGGLHLDLPAEPGSVAIVRRELERHAEILGVSEDRLDDLKTILSEACGNAARYAYETDAEGGQMSVSVIPDGAELEIHVRDQGQGLRPGRHPAVEGLGLGLLMIGALSKSLALYSEAGIGTHLEVRLAISA